MADDDILDLSEPPPPDKPGRPNESHHIRISKGFGTFLLSAGFTAFLGLIIGAFQIAGVVSMSFAHLLIALAWVVAVFAVWLWLLSRPHKHLTKVVVIMALGLGGILFFVDRLMVWKKAEQEKNIAVQPRPMVEADNNSQAICR